MKEIRNFLGLIEESIPSQSELARIGWWIFRGQTQDFPLIPSIGRDSYSYESERYIFNTFKYDAHSYPDSPLKDDWDWLGYAQHHSANTRLLDFSRNPLVALFFACGGSDRPVLTHPDDQLPGFVYALRIGDRPFDHGADIRRTEPIGPNIVYETAKRIHPRSFDPRVMAQHSDFIAFPFPDRPLSEQLASSWRLVRILIPSDWKENLRRQLEFLGFSVRTMFPGPDTIGKTLRRK